MLLLGGIAAAMAGAWAPLGPIPDRHRLLSEAVGPDLVRFEWESPELGHYWIDLTPDRGGSALCTGGGLALQLRKRLDDSPESFELPSLPAPVAAACEALPVAAPLLRGAMLAATPAAEPPPDQEVTASAPVPVAAPRRWHAVVLAWLAALVVALGTGRRARPLGWSLAIGALAMGVRLALAPVTVILGGDAAYERLLSGLGRGGTDRYYGETWMSLLGLVHEVLAALGVTGDRPAELVHDVNLVASTASPPLLYLLARRVGLGERPALLVGAALALWPHAVSLARIEDHAVLVGFLQLLTAVTALAATRSERVLAVLSAALLAHLRPDQLPVATLLLLPLAARRHWLWFLGGAALIGARLAYLPEGGGSPIDFARLLRLGDWPFMLRAWLAAGGALAPPVAALATVGASFAFFRTTGLPPRPRLAWVALVLAATTVPYLPKDLPAADPLRFSLPADAWFLLLAAIGILAAGHAWRRGGRGRAGVIAATVIATFVLRPTAPTDARPWAWEREYQFLRTSLPVPVGDPLGPPHGPGRGWYDDGQDPNGAFRAWLSVSSGMAWHAWGTGTPTPGDLVFRGTADRLAARWQGERCGLDVLHETEVAPTSDGWVDFGAAPVRLSLYTVRDCGGLSGP